MGDLGSFFPLHLFALGTVLDCVFVLLLFLGVLALELGILEMKLLVMIDDGGDITLQL